MGDWQRRVVKEESKIHHVWSFETYKVGSVSLPQGDRPKGVTEKCVGKVFPSGSASQLSFILSHCSLTNQKGKKKEHHAG